MNKQEPEISHREMASDEIDLIQLLLILNKRKYLILLGFVVCVAAGLLYTLLKAPAYKYVTTLQIGSMLEGEEGAKQPIEPVDTAFVKIDNVYIASASSKMLASTEKKMYATAQVQKNSNIILIKSQDLFEMRDVYKEFHGLIIAPLINEHKRLIEVSKKQYELMVEKSKLALRTLEDPRIYMVAEKVMEGNIAEAKSKLIEYDDQNKLLEAQGHRLIETKKLLQEQIKKIEKTLEMAYANRPKASGEVSDEAKALTFLMVNNQIEQSENRLASLRERLFVQLENQKQQLENQLADNRRNWGLQKNKIAEVQSELEKLHANRDVQKNIQKNVIANAESKVELYQNSQVLDLAVRSIDPVGPRNILILALSGILGLMGGIMLAFLAEFMTKIKQQQKIQGEGRECKAQ